MVSYPEAKPRKAFDKNQPHGIRYFQMVSRLQHVSLAAKQLRVAQPSVIIAVKKLEKELGLQLIDRSQKRMTLTAEGRLLLQHAEEILQKVDRTWAEMNDCRQLQKGSVRIGITPIMGAVLFPYAFANFQKKYPEITITVIEEGSQAIRSRLERGDLDVGIMVISNLPPALQTVRIIQAQILACLGPQHPLVNHAVIPLNQLRNEPFLLFEEDTYSHQLIMKECAKCGFTPRIAFCSNQVGTIMGLVKQGVGIDFFIREVVQLYEGIESRPLAGPLYLDAGLAWDKARYLPKAAQAFIDYFPPNFHED